MTAEVQNLGPSYDSYGQELVPLSEYQQQFIEANIEEEYRDYYYLRVFQQRRIDKILHGMNGARLRRLLIPVLLLKRSVIRRRFWARQRKDSFPTEAQCLDLFAQDDLLSLLPPEAHRRLFARHATPIVYTASQVIHVKRERGASSGILIVAPGCNVLVTSRLEQRYHHNQGDDADGGHGDTGTSVGGDEGSVRDRFDAMSATHSLREGRSASSGVEGNSHHTGGPGTTHTGSSLTDEEKDQMEIKRHWVQGPCVLGVDQVIGDAPFDAYKVAVSHDSASGLTVDGLHIPADSLWEEVAAVCCPPSLEAMINAAVKEQGGNRKRVDERAIACRRQKLLQEAEALQSAVLALRSRAVSKFFPLSEFALRNSWLCDSLPSVGLGELVRIANAVSFPPGVNLVERGRQSPYLYFPMKGTLIVDVGSSAKEEKVAEGSGRRKTVRIASAGAHDQPSDTHDDSQQNAAAPSAEFKLLPGMTFGEMSIIFGEARTTTIRTPPQQQQLAAGGNGRRSTQDTGYVDLWRIHREDLSRFMKGNDTYRQLLQARAAKVREEWLNNTKADFVDALTERIKGLRLFRDWDTPLPKSFFDALLAKLQPRVYPQRAIVASTSVICDRIIFIVKGVAKPVRRDIKFFPSFTPDSDDLVLGEACLQPHRWPLAVCSDTILDCFELSRRHLMEVALETIEHQHRRLQYLDLNPAAQFDETIYESSVEELHYWRKLPNLEDMLELKSGISLRLLCHRAKIEEGLVPPTNTLKSYATELRNAWAVEDGETCNPHGQVDDEENEDGAEEDDQGEKDESGRQSSKLLLKPKQSSTRQSAESSGNSASAEVDRKPLSTFERKELLKYLKLEKCPPNLFYIKRSLDRCKHKEQHDLDVANERLKAWGTKKKKPVVSGDGEAGGDENAADGKKPVAAKAGTAEPEDRHAVAPFDPDISTGVDNAEMREKRQGFVEHPYIEPSASVTAKHDRTKKKEERAALKASSSKSGHLTEFHKMFRQDGGFMAAVAVKEAADQQSDHHLRRKGSLKKGAEGAPRKGGGLFDQSVIDPKLFFKSQHASEVGFLESGDAEDDEEDDDDEYDEDDDESGLNSTVTGGGGGSSGSGATPSPALFSILQPGGRDGPLDDHFFTSSSEDEEAEQRAALNKLYDDMPSPCSTPSSLAITEHDLSQDECFEGGPSEWGMAGDGSSVEMVVVSREHQPSHLNLNRTSEPDQDDVKSEIESRDGGASTRVPDTPDTQIADQNWTPDDPLHERQVTVPYGSTPGGSPLAAPFTSAVSPPMLPVGCSPPLSSSQTPASSTGVPTPPSAGLARVNTAKFRRKKSQRVLVKAVPKPYEYEPPRPKTPLRFPNVEEADLMIHDLEQQIDLDEFSMMQQQQQQKLLQLQQQHALQHASSGGGNSPQHQQQLLQQQIDLDEDEEVDHVEQEWDAIASRVLKEIQLQNQKEDSTTKKQFVYGSSALGGVLKPFPPRAEGKSRKSKKTRRHSSAKKKHAVVVSPTRSQQEPDEEPVSLEGLGQMID